jgi:hypothetical protein
MARPLSITMMPTTKNGTEGRARQLLLLIPSLYSMLSYSVCLDFLFRLCLSLVSLGLTHFYSVNITPVFDFA